MNLLILGVITSMLVEPVSEAKDKDGEIVRQEGMQVTAYGLLANGQPKIFQLTKNKALCVNVENCKWTGEDGLHCSALRYWIYFNEGEVSKVDFHMSEQWDQKIIQEFDDQMKSHINKLKEHIESL